MGGPFACSSRKFGMHKTGHRILFVGTRRSMFEWRCERSILDESIVRTTVLLDLGQESLAKVLGEYEMPGLTFMAEFVRNAARGRGLG